MKRNLMLVVLLSVLFVVGAATVTKSSSAGRAAQNQGFSDSDIEKAELGLTLSPVPLSQIGIGRGRTLVGLGSYLVNTSGCNDCHTNPSYLEGNDPFMGQPEKINAAGFLGGGQQFGPFTSRNLTPES